jgi:hypothetical protein
MHLHPFLHLHVSVCQSPCQVQAGSVGGIASSSSTASQWVIGHGHLQHLYGSQKEFPHLWYSLPASSQSTVTNTYYKDYFKDVLRG